MAYYLKIYTKRITLPIIPWEGITFQEATNYYAVLEKNYVPVSSTETWNKSIPNWITVSFTPSGSYNLLNISSCEANTTDEMRTHVFEFRAKNVLSNSIYAIVQQAPKQVLEACIAFDILRDGQIYNDSTKNLNIDGDELTVKVVFYGLRNNEIYVNNTKLYIEVDGTFKEVTKYTDNVISLKQTGYGNVVLYKFDENTSGHDITVKLKCVHQGAYGIKVEAIAIIVLKYNTYSIELKLKNGTIFSNNDTKLPFICIARKNGNLVYDNIKLNYDFYNTNPLIIVNSYSKEIDEKTKDLVYTLNIQKNNTPMNRFVSITATYKDKTSNILVFEQECSNISIEHDFDGELLPGIENIKNITYYGKVTYADGSYDKITSYNNRYKTGDIVTSLDYTYSEVDFANVLNSTIIGNELVLRLFHETNLGNDARTTTLKLMLGTVTKLLTINQDICRIVIETLDTTTKVIGGLYDDINTINLYASISISGQPVTSVSEVDVLYPETIVDYNTYNKENKGSYFHFQYFLKDNGDYGYGATATKNGEVPPRELTFTVVYGKTRQNIVVILNPVYFDLKTLFYGGSNTDNPYEYNLSTGTYNLNVSCYGIIYNMSNDKKHYITVANDDVTIIKISDDTTSSIDTGYSIYMDAYAITNKKWGLSFEPNYSGDIRTYNFTTAYKGVTLELTVKQEAKHLYTKIYVKEGTTEKPSPLTYVFSPFEGHTYTITSAIYDPDDNSVVDPAKLPGTHTMVSEGELTKFNTTDQKTGILTTSEMYFTDIAECIVKYTYTEPSGNVLTDQHLFIKPLVYTVSLLNANSETPVFNKLEYKPIMEQEETEQIINVLVKYRSVLNGVSEFDDLGTKGKYTVKCGTASVTQVTTTDTVNFKFKPAVNESINIIKHNIEVSYTYEDYDIKETITIIQKGCDYTLYLSFDLTFTESNKTVNMLAHDDVYLYVKAASEYETLSIDSKDVRWGSVYSMAKSSEVLYVETLSGNILKYRVVTSNSNTLEQNNNIINRTREFDVMFTDKTSSSVKLTQLCFSSSTETPHLGLVLTEDPTTDLTNVQISALGLDVVYTYYATYDGEKLNIPASYYIFNSEDSYEDYDLEGPEYLKRRQYGENYENTSKSFTTTVQLKYHTTVKKTITTYQEAAIYSAGIESSLDAFDSYNETLRTPEIIYYGLINSTHKSTFTDPKLSISSIREITNVTAHSYKNNDMHVTYRIPINNDTVPVEYTFIVTYKDEFTTELTIVLKENIPKIRLLSLNDTDYTEQPETISLSLTANNPVNASDNYAHKLSLSMNISIHDDLVLLTEPVYIDIKNTSNLPLLYNNYNMIEGKSVLYYSGLVPENFKLSELTYELHPLFHYDLSDLTKYKAAPKIVITQEAAVLECNISSDSTSINDEGESIQIKFNGVHSSIICTDPSKLTLYYNDSLLDITCSYDAEYVTVIINIDVNMTGETLQHKFKARYTYFEDNYIESEELILEQEQCLNEVHIEYVTDKYDEENSMYYIAKEGSLQVSVYYYCTALKTGKYLATETMFNDLTFTLSDGFEEGYTPILLRKTIDNNASAGPRVCAVYSVSPNVVETGLSKSKLMDVTVTLSRGMEGSAMCLIKQYGDAKPLPKFDYFTFKYSFPGGSGRDLDTATILFTDKGSKDLPEVNASGGLTGKTYTFTNWVGYGGSQYTYMKHYGDNTNTGGEEAVTINIKDIISNYLNNTNRDIFTYVNNYIYIDILGTWFGSLGNGYVNLSFELYTGTSGFNQSGTIYVPRSSDMSCIYRESKGVTLTVLNKISNGVRNAYGHIARLSYNIKTGESFLTVASRTISAPYNSLSLS